jgi:hypothetical protein
MTETEELIDHPTEDYYWDEPELDMGDPAIDRVASSSFGYTRLNLNNPATAAGKLETIRIFAATDMTGVRLGTFFLTGGTTYQCRSAVAIGNISAGSEVYCNSLGLDVQVGDVIGIYYTAGSIDRSTEAGATGMGSVSGNKVTAGVSASYTITASLAISLRGTSQAKWGFATWA